jgi:hypothetical protein
MEEDKFRMNARLIGSILTALLEDSNASALDQETRQTLESIRQFTIQHLNTLAQNAAFAAAMAATLVAVLSKLSRSGGWANGYVVAVTVPIVGILEVVDPHFMDTFRPTVNSNTDIN